MVSTVVDYPGGSSHCCESHTDLTEAQINWQMNAAVTFGVRGLIYFTYGAISDAGSGKHPGVVTASGKPAPHYWEAQRVNKRLANLGPTLMQLRSLATVQLLCDAEFGHGGTASRLLGRLKGSPIVDITEPDNSTQASMVLGLFRHEQDQRKAVILFNYEFAFTAWITVHFDASTAVNTVTEMDGRTGAERPLEDQEPGMPGVQLFFEASEMRLLLFGQNATV